MHQLKLSRRGPLVPTGSVRHTERGRCEGYSREVNRWDYGGGGDEPGEDGQTDVAERLERDKGGFRWWGLKARRRRHKGRHSSTVVREEQRSEDRVSSGEGGWRGRGLEGGGWRGGGKQTPGPPHTSVLTSHHMPVLMCPPHNSFHYTLCDGRTSHASTSVAPPSQSNPARYLFSPVCFL